MRSSRAASALLVALFGALLMAGCAGSGSGASAAGTCSGSGPRVEVVVELGNHHVVDRCVSFKGSVIAGETALRRSGIEFATTHTSFGDEVCQVDNEPKSYTVCFPPAPQPYWALFLWSGKGPWKSAATGISEVKLKSGQALGWRYVPDQGKAPAPARPPKS